MAEHVTSGCYNRAEAFVEELLLPLFPLEIVVFPEELVALHISEEGHKQMIGECLSTPGDQPQRSRFGIVLARGRGIEHIGSSARIADVTRRYSDGRMDIHVLGRSVLKSSSRTTRSRTCAVASTFF